ncbi:MAG TPA: ectonucleotide pyrophosphatase/phosphodiesterase [Terracidiphilus sp.]|jgi:predicted AlkP superfamily pyrophosphatase or phosphodiesterase|nr:ectonucleotide pyrophosphatase/phosphodiesterase [Terracidiphilus sp.]
MTATTRGILLRATLVLTLVLAAASVWAAPVLMISIDGLKPEYVTHADEHGLRIPTLRRFIAEGTYAEGVIPSLPTVTYPNHTTLITGVWPAEHGILNNQIFDPERKFSGAWNWYAESIKVPTLWDAAHQAGIGTASVSWPVSVNATSVDTLIPEYWHGTSVGDGENAQDRYLMVAISRPDGALEEMEQRLGPYMMGNNTSVEKGDEIRTRFALDILEHKKPGFMTIHLSAMDASEHETGIYSPEADKTLEAVDGMVARLMAAALKNDPAAKIVVVSDHGFLNVTHSVNFYIPFLAQGLVTFGKHSGYEGETTVVTSWKAQLWSGGGVTAVYLHDPADPATRDQVYHLLTTLASDPANGIDQILDERQIAERGGFPGAAYLIVMKQGYVAGAAVSGPLVVEAATVHGTHGFWPLFPEMRSSFFVLGQGVAHGRNLGVIDMRQIAPTVAGILGVSLPTAKQPPVQLAP